MKRFKLYVLACPLLALSVWGMGQAGGMFTSNGYTNADRFLREIRQGIRPEFAKLFLVTELLRDSNLTVVYGGTKYDVNSAIAKVRGYLARNYSGETAEEWIRKHLHRSPAQGEVIYFEYPDGRLRPVRDVLLDELRRLAV